jgi:secreted PhoX family phosphatase
MACITKLRRFAWEIRVGGPDLGKYKQLVALMHSDADWIVDLDAIWPASTPQRSSIMGSYSHATRF